MRGGGNRDLFSGCWSLREMQVLLSFHRSRFFHDLILPIVLLKRKIAITLVALWCDR